MEPKKLAMMLDQWARANAPDFSLKVENVDVAMLGVADSEMITEGGDRGGVFSLLVATLSVREVVKLIYADERVVMRFQSQSEVEEFERLFFQLCHDIWLSKDIAIRGRLVVSK